MLHVSGIQLCHRTITDTMAWLLFMQEHFQNLTQEELENTTVAWEANLEAEERGMTRKAKEESEPVSQASHRRIKKLQTSKDEA